MRRRTLDAFNTVLEAASELGEQLVLAVARRWLGIPHLEARVAEIERLEAQRDAKPTNVRIEYGDDFADDSPRARRDRVWGDIKKAGKEP
jgi:hypothetical protein